jgi:hypothetical protein
MGRVCSTHGEEEECPRSRWEDNIKMILDMMEWCVLD